MPFFEPTRFYTRQQGNAVYNFYYSADKQLIAKIVRDGNTQQLQVDIPRDLQVDLDEEKISKLRMMFDQSYFGTQCGKILVNAHGLGGWNEDVHWAMTYQMARKVRFAPKYAKIIANACQRVDDLSSGMSPYPFVGDQSWHFNPQNRWNRWATEHDPRRIHAFIQLEGAIIRGDLEGLGYGLHALQDMFSHTPDFQYCLGYCAHGTSVDNIHTEPQQRFIYTQQATLLYLQGFLSGNYAQAQADLIGFLRYVRQHPPKIPNQRDRLIAQSISSGGGDPRIAFQSHTMTH